MTVRPIIFSAPMVRALLDGRKTQTRRLATSPLAKCKPGDLLWVRESCADQHPLAIQDGRYSQPGRAGIPGPPGISYRTVYRADGEPLQIWRLSEPEYPYFARSGPASDADAKYPTVRSNFVRAGKSIYWTPSIHMPRWASRITLEVFRIRTQPLREISDSDAIAEGCALSRAGYYCGRPHPAHGAPRQFNAPREAFADIWKCLHGEDSWQRNPTVVALTFTVHKQNIDDFLRQREAA